MKTSKISYRNTNRFNQLVLDYLDQKAELSQFVTSFPNIGEFNKHETVKSTDPSLLVELEASTIILETVIDEGSSIKTSMVSTHPKVFPVTMHEYNPADNATAESPVCPSDHK